MPALAPSARRAGGSPAARERALIVVITDLATVPEPALERRLRALEPLSPALRARVVVQLRDRERSARERLALGTRLRALTLELGLALVVNDRLDLALALGADGVHLGEGSVRPDEARALLPEGALVSVACHEAHRVAALAATGAVDLVLLSPVLASPGKGPALGLEALTAARAALDAALAADVARRPAGSLVSRVSRVSLVALGGLDEAHVGPALAAGAHGVAAIRAEPLALVRAAASCPAPPA